MNILVLGLGNILLSDEGVGVRVVEALQERYMLPSEIEVVDGGTAGMDLLNTLAGRDHLIVCDAVNADLPPGSVIRLVDDDVPAFFQAKMSPHQLGLCDVLATLKLIDQIPAHVTLIGVVPENIDLGTNLSPNARFARNEALQRLVGELECIGVDVVPRNRFEALPA